MGKKISEDEYSSLIEHANQKGIKLVSFKNYDGDVELIHEMIDNADSVLKDLNYYAECVKIILKRGGAL